MCKRDGMGSGTVKGGGKGEARRGEARRGEARRGEARRGEARRGEARHLLVRAWARAWAKVRRALLQERVAVEKISSHSDGYVHCVRHNRDQPGAPSYMNGFRSVPTIVADNETMTAFAAPVPAGCSHLNEVAATQLLVVHRVPSIDTN